MRYKAERISKLRNDFCKAYKTATGENLLDGLTKYKNDEYFEGLRKDMRQKLGISNKDELILSTGTFSDFLLDREKLNYAPATLLKFKNYIAAVSAISSGNISTKRAEVTLQGAQYIDEAFKRSLKRKKHRPIDFYLSRKDNECQWYGIAKEWDFKRKDFDNIKAKVINAFSWQSRIIAIVHGTGGSGKSTLLRRLAFDCTNEVFSTIWITNLNLFCENDISYLEKSGKKYLLIIEDWSFYENHLALTNKFMDFVLSNNNFRILLAERDIRNKEYLKYLLTGNSFQLLPDENNEIISQKVLYKNGAWKQASTKLLSKTGIYNAPLFIILFLLNSSSDGEYIGDSDDARTLFEEIIKSDLKKLYGIYPPYVLAINHISCILKGRNLEVPLSAFEILVANYAEILNLENGPNRFELEVVKNILSKYFSSRKLLYPFDEDMVTINFHHTILMEVLSQSYIEGWYVDDEENLNFIFDLIIAGNSFARDLYDELDWRHTLFDSDETSFFDQKIRGGLSTTRANTLLSDIISDYYKNARTVQDEDYWQKSIILLSWFFIYDESDYLFNIVTNLKELGCTDRWVAEICERSTNDKLNLVAELTERRWAMSPNDYGEYPTGIWPLLP